MAQSVLGRTICKQCDLPGRLSGTHVREQTEALVYVQKTSMSRPDQSCFYKPGSVNRWYKLRRTWFFCPDKLCSGVRITCD